MCDDFKALPKRNSSGHYCTLPLTSAAAWGPAVIEVFEDEDGFLWATNSHGKQEAEYASKVPFCPVCGTAAIKRN